MVVVYLGLGSNIGEKKQHIQKALTLLPSLCTVKRVSPLYLTEPVGNVEQDWFLNGVVEVETELEPKKLLSSLKTIERKVGRKKTIKNGPRVIDIDILFYGNEIITLKDLSIPHPHLQERLFVLQPLMDLAPELVHPVLHKTIRELFTKQPWAEIVTPYK